MEPKMVIMPFDKKQVNSRLMSILLSSTIMTTVIRREGGNRNPQLWKGRLQSSKMKGDIGILRDERGDCNPQRERGDCNPQRWEGRLQSSDMRGERGHSEVSGEWGHFDPLRWEATVILRGLRRRQYGASLCLQWLGETTVCLTNLVCRHKLAWNPHKLTNYTDWYKDKMEVYSLQR